MMNSSLNILKFRRSLHPSIQNGWTKYFHTSIKQFQYGKSHFPIRTLYGINFYSNTSSTEHSNILSSRLIHHINKALKEHPHESIVYLFASDIVSIFGMYGLLGLTGISISPEFALAFSSSRLIRKFRLPVDILAAATLAKMFPMTTRIQFSSLTEAFSISKALEETKTSNNNKKVLKLPSWLNKGTDSAKNMIDKYGAAYFIGSRFVGTTVVFSIYFALKQGIDIMPILTKYGVNEVGTTIGTWAAAVVLTSTIYPITLLGTGFIVPLMAKGRHKLKSKTKEF